METLRDQWQHETPFHRGGVQRLLLVTATLGVLGIWWTSPTPSPPLQHQPSKPLLRLDLNTAGMRELSLLPSVGPTLAARIVENRERWGTFRTVEELGRVHGIGDKSIAAIRPYCYVEPHSGIEVTAESPSFVGSR